MSDFTTKRCDAPGCGRLKQEANHWFKVITGASFHVLDDSSMLGQIDSKRDVCGEDCAHKLLSEWFQQQKEAA